MTPNAQPREEWREAYDATGLSERIQSVELFAINHGFKEWDGITIPAFIESVLSSQRAEEYRRGVKDGESRTKNGVGRYQMGYADARAELAEKVKKLRVSDDASASYHNMLIDEVLVLLQAN